MEHVTEANFQSMVEQAAMPVVLDFGATWCSPCKKLEPILEEIGIELKDKVIMVKVDIEQAPAIAQKFGVMGVPTVIFLKEGRPVHRFAGVEPKAKITKMLAEHFGI